jgi:hypothetical protein
MQSSGPRTVLCIVVAALTMLAGCAGDGGDDEGAAESSSSTSGATSPTSAPPPVETSSTTASTTAGGTGCPGDDPVPPEGAQEVSEVSADVDGDGADDRVFAYRRGDGTRRVGVELAAGGTAAVDANAVAIEGPAPLSALGGVALGGDGETVFALTGAGASVIIVGLFQFVECALARVVYSSGEDAELPVSGAITHGDGIACTDETLVRLSATSTDGETFTTTDTSYQVDGNTLIEVDSETATLTRATDDEEINRYYVLDCPALENPPGEI